MFLGEYRHTIDDKGRLTIPAKFRGMLATGMVITRGFDRNLMAFSLDGWEELSTRIRSLPMADPESRELRRRLFAGAIDVVPDRQGRVLIPPYLREFAGIDSEVAISGMYSYFEIWDQNAWQPVLDRIESDDGHWEGLGI